MRPVKSSIRSPVREMFVGGSFRDGRRMMLGSKGGRWNEGNIGGEEWGADRCPLGLSGGQGRG